MGTEAPRPRKAREVTGRLRGYNTAFDSIDDLAALISNGHLIGYVEHWRDPIKDGLARIGRRVWIVGSPHAAQAGMLGLLHEPSRTAVEIADEYGILGFKDWKERHGHGEE